MPTLPGPDERARLLDSAHWEDTAVQNADEFQGLGRDVNGYVWESNDCLACHSRGKE